MVKGYESQGGNFLFADSPKLLEEYRLSLDHNMDLLPMKKALEENYPIQCLNNYDYLDDLASDYKESVEIQNRINESLGVFHFQNVEVLLVGSVMDNQLALEFEDSYGDESFIITENYEMVLEDQVALRKENREQAEFLINQGFIADKPCNEYTNKWEEDILVFQLSSKGLEVKKDIGNKQNQNKLKQKQSHKDMNMEI